MLSWTLTAVVGGYRHYNIIHFFSINIALENKTDKEKTSDAILLDMYLY